MNSFDVFVNKGFTVYKYAVKSTSFKTAKSFLCTVVENPDGKIKLDKLARHSCMPSPLAPDPIRVH